MRLGATRHQDRRDLGRTRPKPVRWRTATPNATLARVDRELEALRKARGHVADVTQLAEMAKEHLEEGRFEEASACLRLIEQHAALGREGLGPLLNQ